MSDRTRNWATLIYPRQTAEDVTECPDNWVEVLEQMGVKACVSPLHDKDVKEDGTFKKAHRHVLFSFDGVKSKAQVVELCRKLGGISPEPINSMYAQVRYLTHKDNKDKAQYSSLDVLTFGGFEYKRYASTKEDEDKDTNAKMGKIFNIMAEMGLQEFAEVAEYLMSEEPELFSVYRKNSYFFAQFIRSKQNFTCQKAEKNILYQLTRNGGLQNPHSGNNNEEKGGNNETPIRIEGTDKKGGCTPSCLFRD